MYPSVAPITALSITSGTPAPYMRPTDTMVVKPTLMNLRSDSSALGGGPRRIELQTWIFSLVTGWIYVGYSGVDLNPGQTLTPTINVPLAPLNLPYGYYTLEVDAIALYPTNGAQFIPYTFTGWSWKFASFYLTPPMAAAVTSVKTNALSYLRGQTATITVTLRNVGTQPYMGTLSLLLMDPSGNLAAVIPSVQVSIAVGGTLTVNVAWPIPLSLPPGPITYKLVASTGSQGWTSSSTTNVIIT